MSSSRNWNTDLAQTRAPSAYPRLFVFPFLFGSNSLQACVPYLCDQTTGKSKDMASPNLSVQCCHATLFKQRRASWTLPPQTQTQISHFRQCLRKKEILNCTFPLLHLCIFAFLFLLIQVERNETPKAQEVSVGPMLWPVLLKNCFEFQFLGFSLPRTLISCVL